MNSSLGVTGSVSDISLISLVLNADIVVKLVMGLLILASFWSWAIIFTKIPRLRLLSRQANQFEDAFWSGGSLEELYDRVGTRPEDPMSAVFSSAMREWRRSASRGVASGVNRASLQERMERVMSVTIGREMERLERWLPFLASVGSTAPFIGLFGTVWGIMNSFTAIAADRNTNLAVVAPGIAEALIATAIGLFAAIPAVLAYNSISSDLGRYSARLDAFADEFAAILSRQLDERG